MARWQNKMKEVFRTEIAELVKVGENINSEVDGIVELLYSTIGKVVVMGVGKSGIVGKKIASSFASTGTPAIFVNADEAVHGDLGMISPDDVVVLISNSGSTYEVLNVVPHLRKLGCRLIAMTGNENSELAALCDYTLSVHVDKEVCPLGLAPTTSTTATMLMGDALMVCLMEKRNFSRNNFATYHPGGALGKKLKAVVKDSMSSSIPSVLHTAPLVDVVKEMSDKHFGMTLVKNNKNEYVGIITDGDLRRAIEKYESLSFLAENVMTRNFKHIHKDAFLSDALNLMDEYNITTLPVTELPDSENIIGILSIHHIIDFK